MYLILESRVEEFLIDFGAQQAGGGSSRQQLQRVVSAEFDEFKRKRMKRSRVSIKQRKLDQLKLISAKYRSRDKATLLEGHGNRFRSAASQDSSSGPVFPSSNRTHSGLRPVDPGTMLCKRFTPSGCEEAPAVESSRELIDAIDGQSLLSLVEKRIYADDTKEDGPTGKMKPANRFQSSGSTYTFDDSSSDSDDSSCCEKKKAKPSIGKAKKQKHFLRRENPTSTSITFKSSGGHRPSDVSLSGGHRPSDASWSGGHRPSDASWSGGHRPSDASSVPRHLEHRPREDGGSRWYVDRSKREGAVR